MIKISRIPKTEFVLPEDLHAEILDFALNSGTEYFREMFNRDGEEHSPAKNVTVGGRQMPEYEKNSWKGRKFCRLSAYDIPLSRKVQEYSNYMFAQIGVDVKEETTLGNFMHKNGDGSHVQMHTDPRHINGDWHCRMNFLIQKPLEGGKTVIEGIAFTVEERESWLNFANVWMHGCEPIFGERERITLSLGSYVNPVKANQLMEYYSGNGLEVDADRNRRF